LISCGASVGVEGPRRRETIGRRGMDSAKRGEGVGGHSSQKKKKKRGEKKDGGGNKKNGGQFARGKTGRRGGEVVKRTHPLK